MIHIICYDATGYIYHNQAGDVRKPEGIQNMLEVEVPDGQFAERIDLTGDEPQVILKDLPKSQETVLREQLEDAIARIEYIELLSNIEE